LGCPCRCNLLRRPGAQRRHTDPLLDPIARPADSAVPVQHATVLRHRRPRRFATHAAFPTGPYPDDQLTHDPDPPSDATPTTTGRTLRPAEPAVLGGCRPVPVPGNTGR